jgi:4-amino-4-deoxy-L-arabinose transferase-like glycosyltransferase
VLDLITGYNGIMRYFGPEEGTAGSPPSFEIGDGGWGRFLTPPLAKEISWLIPLALLGIGLVLFSAPVRLPLSSDEQRGGLLWGGWLLTGLVFFSLAGFFHAYYLVMLAPPLAAGVGMGVSMLWRDREQWRRNLLLLVGFVAVTLVFQIALAGSYGLREAWIYAPLVLFLFGVLFLALFRSRRGAPLLEVGAWGFLLVAVLVIPFGWSVLTALDENPHSGLPSAYQGCIDIRQLPSLDQPGPVERRLIEYLSQRVREGAYLLAVPSAQQGALVVLETGKPVLYMGGFNGTDPVIDADGLAEMVERGDLRFVLYSRAGRWRVAQIGNWLDSACQIVPEFSPPDGQERRSPPSEGNPGLVYPPVLYDCGG